MNKENTLFKITEAGVRWELMYAKAIAATSLRPEPPKAVDRSVVGSLTHVGKNRLLAGSKVGVTYLRFAPFSGGCGHRSAPAPVIEPMP